MKTKPAEMTVEQYRLSITHDELQGSIIEIATALGYENYFTWRSYHSPAGFPDLWLARERDVRLVIIEVKTEKDELSPAQQKWINVLTLIASVNNTIDVSVVRPSNYDECIEKLK